MFRWTNFPWPAAFPDFREQCSVRKLFLQGIFTPVPATSSSSPSLAASSDFPSQRAGGVQETGFQPELVPCPAVFPSPGLGVLSSCSGGKALLPAFSAGRGFRRVLPFPGCLTLFFRASQGFVPRQRALPGFFLRQGLLPDLLLLCRTCESFNLRRIETIYLLPAQREASGFQLTCAAISSHHCCRALPDSRLLRLRARRDYSFIGLKFFIRSQFFSRRLCFQRGFFSCSWPVLLELSPQPQPAPAAAV